MIILKGAYDILIKDKRTEFRFTIKRKYTLLVGDSATGKSKLYKMLESPETFIEVSSQEGQEVSIFRLQVDEMCILECYLAVNQRYL